MVTFYAASRCFVPSKIEWDLTNGPRSVSYDRAIRYSGFFRAPWNVGPTVGQISWIDLNFYIRETLKILTLQICLLPGILKQHFWNGCFNWMLLVWGVAETKTPTPAPRTAVAAWCEQGERLLRAIGNWLLALKNPHILLGGSSHDGSTDTCLLNHD